MKIHQRVLLVVWLLIIALLPVRAATYKGSITVRVGETTRVNIGSGYMGTEIITSGYWDKSNSTFIIESVSGMYHKECTIRGNKVGSGKLYWDGYIFGDSWDFYWDVNVVPADVKVTSISLSPSTMNLEVGKSQYISETVYPSNATNKTVSWSSSPTGIVTVSSTGEVKAIKEGTTTVTCKATDGSGKYATCKVTVTKPDVVVAEINATNFPDASFRSWLLSQTYGADGKLTESEISSITSISVFGSSSSPRTIKSLKGIEYFTALTSLYCYNNQLTSLDVSNLTALTSLSCYKNQLTSLDVSRLTALTSLYCDDNQLTSLSIIVNTALKILSCSNNQLTSLDVSKNTNLQYLSCSRNNLSSLNLLKNTALSDLSCGENQLTTLDVSKNKELEYLYCAMNQLTSLDISNNTKLKSLTCWNNNLTLLNVSANTVLKSLSCGNNSLTTLDVSKNSALEDLTCYGNHLSSLLVSNNTALKTLHVSNNKIRKISMGTLINSLPPNNSNNNYYFYVLDNTDNDENVCTKEQVAVAKAKGWTPMYRTTNWEWIEYEGCDDTPTTKGDVNGDNQVNGTDLVALTNIILGKNAQTTAADVNGDGYVNGTDYVALANIVLGRSNAKASAMAKGAVQAVATTGLTIEPLDIKAGESKEMVIDLTNPNDEITLVQFDLRLPAGLSVKQTGGEYDIDIAGRTTWRKHSLDANATNGIVRFLLASSSNATLTGTEGAVIKITIAADNSFTGGDIQLENILMVTPAEKEIKQDVYTYHVGQSQPSPASTGLAIEPFSISAGGEAEMVIDMTNPDDEITLVQFDLRLPAGLSVKQTGGEYDYDIAGRTTWRKHSLDANATNGIVRFLLASSSNATLTGTEGAIIKIALKADNTFAGGAVKLENILLVTPAEKEIKQSDVNYTIGTTGIKGVASGNIEKDAPIYNLSGQRLNKPRKGINIIGGKKVMVK